MAHVVSKSEMRHVSVDELRQMASDYRESIWAQAQAIGREPKIYLHWTAGHYGQFWDDYHVQIDEDGEIYVYGELDEILAHTWRRNTGAIGVTLLCGYLASANGGLGPEPPTAAQIEGMALAIEALADGLWLTISKEFVATHGEAADNECNDWCHEDYGPRTTCERWDLEYLQTDESPAFNPWAEDGSRGGDVLRGKANWYRNQRG